MPLPRLRILRLPERDGFYHSGRIQVSLVCVVIYYNHLYARTCCGAPPHACATRLSPPMTVTPPAYNVACSAPVNIALIKYWGKRDVAENLPLNSSLSVTLSQDDLSSVTTVRTSPLITSDTICLNGKTKAISENPRWETCVEKVRELRRGIEEKENLEEDKRLSEWGLEICTENNFPTGAGLASSASGLACLVYALAVVMELYRSPDLRLADHARRLIRSYPRTNAPNHLPAQDQWPFRSQQLGQLQDLLCETPDHAEVLVDTSKLSNSQTLTQDSPFSVEQLAALSVIVRQGSGSACRSLFGPFAAWDVGIDSDSSIGYPISAPDHWKDLRVIIAITSVSSKPVSSTAGMLLSAATSPFLKHRSEHLVRPRMLDMQDAILRKDFSTVGKLAMMDSNNMHACCLDTFPPLQYMSDKTREVVRLVQAFNDLKYPEWVTDELRAAYTVDAGPNVVILVPHTYEADLASFFHHYYPTLGASPTSSVHAPVPEGNHFLSVPTGDAFKSWLEQTHQSSGRLDIDPHGVKRLIRTCPGTGPRILGFWRS